MICLYLKRSVLYGIETANNGEISVYTQYLTHTHSNVSQQYLITIDSQITTTKKKYHKYLCAQ